MINYPTSAVYLRNYEELFTGTNQEFGYQHPLLGFESDTTQQKLKVDMVTFFHYPSTINTLSLSSSNLISDGAIAGNIPFNSDKIWKKQANYQKYIYWGESKQPQYGTWLCAWLSGNPNNIPVWMDRWYNPGYYNSITDTYVSYSSGVYDEPSTLVFEPGCYYKYFHIGDQTNLNIVNSLSGSLSGLLLHIQDWKEDIKDLSPYNNEIVYNNFNSNMISQDGIKGKCLSVDSEQNASILYNDNYNITDKFTASTWIKTDNWNNIKGYQILGRGLRGGWNIRNNNGFFTPLITLLNSNTNIIQGNNQLIINTTKSLPGTSLPINCVLDNELYTWVLDNGLYNNNKHLYKVDYNSNINSSVAFSSSVNLSDLVLDKDSNIWVLNSLTCEASSFNKTGTFLQTLSFAGTNINNIDITIQNQVCAINCNDMCFDNNDNLWYTTTAGLYLNENIINSSNNITQIKCDKNNNIWCLQDDYYLKYSNNNLVLSGQILTDYISGGFISLTNEYEEQTNLYKDYVWFVYSDPQKIFKYDLNGTKVNEQDLSTFELNAINKDFTSYEWYRKFDYLAHNINTNRIESEIYIGTQTIPICGKQTLFIETSTLSLNNWHHFAITYNNIDGNLKFYVDSIERDNKIITPGYDIYYEYENNLLIGLNSGKINSFDKDILLDNLQFKGQVDDIRIYNYDLVSSNLWNIIALRYNFKDLIWNMATGMQGYLEEIERFFKCRLPGMKSQYYNIRLIGLNITDSSVRVMIEDIIKTTVKRIAPLQTELYRIIWD